MPESSECRSLSRNMLCLKPARHVRSLLCVLCAMIFTCIEPSFAGDLASEIRDQARHKQRRIIYNSDGGDMYGYDFSSVEEFLARRTERAVGTQVDSLFYCTGVTTVYSHDTDVAERFDDLMDATGKFGEQAMRWRNNMAVLRKASVDQLSATVRRAHEAGMEVFWSHRINDTHDSVLEWDHLLSQWKRQHPEYLMGTAEDTKKYPSSHPRHYWSSLDFEKPQVRDYLFRVTEEICRRYDVDGIEIDYCRDPAFFRPNLDGIPATKNQLDILTGFQRLVRQMAEREGNKRGRPILVAGRVPMAVANCRNVGIDIERWLREDLLDLLILGNGTPWPNMPAEELVKLGHKYNVPTYPCIKWGSYGPATPEAFRAAASNAWRTGADGIYFFNIDMFPDTIRPLSFTQFGDPGKIATLDKLFAATDTAPYTDRILLLPPGQQYCGLAQVLPLAMALPAKLSPGPVPHIVTLQIGDGIAAASERGTLAAAVLTVRMSDPERIDRIEIGLNGQQLTPTALDPEEGRLTFNPKPAWYRVGDNDISFLLEDKAGSGSSPLQVLSVEVQVKYK